MLRLSELSKRYGDVVALDDCSFEVAPGTLFGFLGPNGAGKTTAMRAIFGLVRPDRGEVTWHDAPIDAATRHRFGYMPEQRGLYPRMKIAAQLAYFGRLHGMERGDAEASAGGWLDTLGLADRADAKLEQLSHGNQQRVQLATALVHDPDLLVLDEPFSGLDPLGVRAMADILAERAAAGNAVVFSSHQLDLVEDLCDSVAVINQGRIVLAGRVGQLKAASRHRYLEVQHATPSGSWHQALDGVVEVVEEEPERVVLMVDRDTDPEAILHVARQAGTLQAFSFTPPSLSQVFVEAVGT
jgi:ABC-2 type transport system ATP-binding protein